MRIPAMLSVVMAGLLLLVCQPSLSAVEQSGYLPAPDAVLAVLPDQRHDTAAILGANQVRTCSEAAFRQPAADSNSQSSPAESLSPGGATVCGTGETSIGDVSRHPGTHERMRPG